MFILDNPLDFKIVFEPETIHHKNVNNSVLNILIFYLEFDDKHKVELNDETIKFNLSLTKI